MAKIVSVKIIIEDCSYFVAKNDKMYSKLDSMSLKDTFEIKGLGRLGIRYISYRMLDEFFFEQEIEFTCYKIETTLPFD